MTFNLLDLILPPTCLGCKSEGVYICDKCVDSMNLYNFFTCPICKRRDSEGKIDENCKKESELTRFLGAPLPYRDEKVKKIIHSFKYNYAKEAAEPLSQILINFLEKNNFRDLAIKKRNLAIVPVPLFHFRERERGFNQAEELAKKINSYYNIPIEGEVLKKIKNTSPQAEIKNKDKRAQNVLGVFSCQKPEVVRGKTIILLDDVYTSGSTMRECARMLRQSGAREIWGMTLARGKS